MSFFFLFMLTHHLPLMVGYSVGALMHLIFDGLVNGEHAIRRPVLFYVFAYRMAQGFAATKLMKESLPAEAGQDPIREFFRWTPVTVSVPVTGAPAPNSATQELGT